MESEKPLAGLRVGMKPDKCMKLEEINVKICTLKGPPKGPRKGRKYEFVQLFEVHGFSGACTELQLPLALKPSALLQLPS